MKQILTTNQKRFLIIWVIVHSFALFTNLAGIRALISPSLPENGQTGYQICLFTQYDPDGFWPFVQFFKESNEQVNANDYGKIVYFNGLFYSYDLTAYVFYIALGFGVIFVPKLWKAKPDKSQ